MRLPQTQAKENNVLVAQLVEQLTLNQWVQGSNPCQDTKSRGVAQLASAPRSGRGGRKFESSHPDNKPRLRESNRQGCVGLLNKLAHATATLAQLVEQRIRNA